MKTEIKIGNLYGWRANQKISIYLCLDLIDETSNKPYVKILHVKNNTQMVITLNTAEKFLFPITDDETNI